MGIDDFIINFIKKNKNSNTTKLLSRNISSSNTFSMKCRIIDDAIKWNFTEEGYYYYYFLQLRLAMQLAKFCYKKGDIIHAKESLGIANSIRRYCSDWHHYKKIGTVFIDKNKFNAIVFHNDEVMKKLYHEIYEKKFGN